jgi:hypothetical protein
VRWPISRRPHHGRRRSAPGHLNAPSCLRGGAPLSQTPGPAKTCVPRCLNAELDAACGANALELLLLLGRDGVPVKLLLLLMSSAVNASLSGSSDARIAAAPASIPRPDKSAPVASSPIPQRETRLGLEHITSWGLASCSLPMRLSMTLVTDRALLSVGDIRRGGGVGRGSRGTFTCTWEERQLQSGPRQAPA